MPLVAIVIPDTGALSRKERDELKAFGQERGLRVYDDPKRLDRDFPEAMGKVRERAGVGENDLLLLATWAGEPKGKLPERTTLQACGQLRLNAGQKYNDRHKRLDTKDFRFTWVVDFPMFEWDEEENRWVAAHHPFTSVKDEDIEKLTSDPAHCRAKSYDLVLNGSGTRFGLDPYSPARRAVEGLFSARVQRGGSQAALRIPAGSAGVRRTAPWRHRARPGPRW